MATMDEVDQALLDAIKALADSTATSQGLSTARAACQLAEARAWLLVPDQSHGGGVGNTATG